MNVLAPVKDYLGAVAVIGGGADEIYFASPSFGARVYAAIELDEIKKIIEFAKLAGVKTYATFNTVIFNHELEQFFLEINSLYTFGVDGIIVQDFSFINLLKQNYPKLEIHASTQMHIHNSDGGKFVKALGANRVVVPREMQLSKIKTFKDNVEVEIEAFAHGALCVSYSGQCYDSTLLDQKSANRGRCSQYCRMPQYTTYGPKEKVVSGGEYPLNLRDLNSLENIEAFAKAGVDSLKIEGRLKSIDYAYLTTKAYRRAVDRQLPLIDLSNVYNREFTSGRVMGVNGRQLVNLYRPNNNGAKVGEVIRCEPNKAKSLKYYPYAITIELTKDTVIQTNDNLRFVGEDYEDGQVVEQFKQLSPSRILLFSRSSPEAEDEVFRTSNSSIVNEAKGATFDARRKISVKLFFKKDYLYFSVDGGEIINSEIKFEPAISRPLTKADVLAKLEKTKNTDYIIDVVDFQYNDDMFCQVSKLNQLKNLIIDQASSLETQHPSTKPLVYSLGAIESSGTNFKQVIYIEVNTAKQLELVRKYMPEATLLISYNLFTQGIKVESCDYLVLPSVVYDDELEQIDQAVNEFECIVVSDLGMYKRYVGGKQLLTNFTLNTTNGLNQQSLVNDQVVGTILSIELNKEMIADFGNRYSIVNVYGRIPVMIMDYCPINMTKVDGCGSCRKCRDNEYYMQDKLERKFPLMYGSNNRISMLSNKPISLLNEVDNLIDLGIENLHLRFTIESEEQVVEVLEKLMDNDYERLSFATNSGSFYKQTL